MTNAEKFEEVFGFKPNIDKCPAEDCEDCPVGSLTCMASEQSNPQLFWENDYIEADETNCGAKMKV